MRSAGSCSDAAMRACSAARWGAQKNKNEERRVRCYAIGVMHKLRHSWLALVLMLGADAALAEPDPAEAARYPYDPVCAWGRIANGQGMLVRCLSRGESEALIAGVGFATPPSPAGTGAGAAPVAPAADAGAAPVAPAPDAGAEPEDVPLSAKLVRVVADQGSLPTAEKKLDVPRDRYVECVKKNGGLSGERGEVHVRFLVRARGRAEGVSVAKLSGVSAKAAKCIADVVDRRPTGTPEAPIVGATAIIEIKKGK